jgi:hypothetical protein
MDMKCSVGINRGGGMWCSACGDLAKPCEHFPAEFAELQRLREVNHELTMVMEDIVSEIDQCNGGKGAKLPFSLHIREMAVNALDKVRSL